MDLYADRSGEGDSVSRGIMRLDAQEGVHSVALNT